MAVDCVWVRQFSWNAKEMVIEHRLFIILVYLTLLNMLFHRLKHHHVPTLSFFGHLSSKSKDEMVIRCAQLVIGPLISFVGYSVLSFNVITGCNASEVYLFWFGATVLCSFDIHEFISRWPLRPPVLAHHVMTFGLSICFVDFRLLPPVNGVSAEEDDVLDWTTVLFITNIGLCWMADIFHVVFRVSTTVHTIHRMRTVYLTMSFVRIANIVLVGSSAVRAGMDRSFLGMFFMVFMFLAYSYNTVKALSFVVHFDCDRYFENHQKMWIGNVDKERTQSQGNSEAIETRLED